jgi:hypothetical protein
VEDPSAQQRFRQQHVVSDHEPPQGKVRPCDPYISHGCIPLEQPVTEQPRGTVDHGVQEQKPGFPSGDCRERKGSAGDDAGQMERHVRRVTVLGSKVVQIKITEAFHEVSSLRQRGLLCGQHGGFMDCCPLHLW